MNIELSEQLCYFIDKTYYARKYALFDSRADIALQATTLLRRVQAVLASCKTYEQYCNASIYAYLAICKIYRMQAKFKALQPALLRRYHKEQCILCEHECETVCSCIRNAMLSQVWTLLLKTVQKHETSTESQN